MKADTVVAIGWNCLIPLLAGAFLAGLGVARKYPTVKHYVFTSVSVWFYIIICGLGSVLFSWIMKVSGTRIVNDAVLNEILGGLFAAASFLGIASRISLARSHANDVSAQLKTLHAYIYEVLDDSLSRRITQLIEIRIKRFPKPQDRDGFLNEMGQHIAMLDITAQQKTKLKLRFDEYAGRSDYRSIIRELIKHYDVEYIIMMFSDPICSALAQRENDNEAIASTNANSAPLEQDESGFAPKGPVRSTSRD
jgi:hypothetical protein